MKFKTQFNADQFPTPQGEINRYPSATIPDQTMSIKEIMLRHSRGLPLDGVKIPVYEGEDNDFPDLRTLDLAERQELRENAQSELDEIKERLNKKPKKSSPPTLPPASGNDNSSEQKPAPDGQTPTDGNKLP